VHPPPSWGSTPAATANPPLGRQADHSQVQSAARRGRAGLVPAWSATGHASDGSRLSSPMPGVFTAVSAVACCWSMTVSLPVVCLDEALDELVYVAGLGQVPLGQQLAQLGLGQALVTLTGLLGVLALGLTSLPG
jgi:hypothetical protein